MPGFVYKIIVNNFLATLQNRPRGPEVFHMYYFEFVIINNKLLAKHCYKSLFMMEVKRINASGDHIHVKWTRAN